MLSSLQGIEETVRMREPELRNLRVTLTYHDLEVAMSPSMGETDVRWCAFAVWASKTAGRFVREELPTFMGLCFNAASPRIQGLRALEKNIANVIPGGNFGHNLLIDPIEKILLDLALDVGAGNLKVFAELAPVFRRFIDLMNAGTRYDPAELAAFIATLKPGHVDREGQDLLVRAFGHYHAAKYEQDRSKRAQLTFLGNNLIGLHEQSRLQGPIAASLSAPLKGKMVDALFARLSEHAPRIVQGAIRGVLERYATPVFEAIEAEWRRWATHTLMTLGMPDLLLDLGKDIPPLEGRPFPPDLENLDLPELTEMMREMDRSKGKLERSASMDWADLGDRMSTIINLFRSRQQHKTLWQPPFEPDQVADIRRGVVPVGQMA